MEFSTPSDSSRSIDAIFTDSGLRSPTSSFNSHVFRLSGIVFSDESLIYGKLVLSMYRFNVERIPDSVVWFPLVLTQSAS